MLGVTDPIDRVQRPRHVGHLPQAPDTAVVLAEEQGFARAMIFDPITTRSYIVTVPGPLHGLTSPGKHLGANEMVDGP